MRLCGGHLLVIPSMLTTGLGDLMSAKMNWDRVRKESQTRRSGSEWIGSDAVGTTPGKEIKSSRQRQYVQTGQPSGRSRMPGCFCGKVTGFRESHKKRCPLSKSLNLRINSRSNRNFSFRVHQESGKTSLHERVLVVSSNCDRIDLARSFSEQDRQRALKLIRALLESMPDTPAVERAVLQGVGRP